MLTIDNSIISTKELSYGRVVLLGRFRIYIYNPKIKIIESEIVIFDQYWTGENYLVLDGYEHPIIYIFTPNKVFEYGKNKIIIREIERSCTDIGRIEIYDLKENKRVQYFSPYNNFDYSQIFEKIKDDIFVFSFDRNTIEIWDMNIMQCNIKIKVVDCSSLYVKQERFIILGNNIVSTLRIKV